MAPSDASAEDNDADRAEADSLAGSRDASGTPRYTRRLQDKILISFHQACDQQEFEVADQLLRIFEFMLTRKDLATDVNRRRQLDSLVAAHERLWHLRHRDAPNGFR